MRTSFAIQPLPGNTATRQLSFNPNSRDDTEVLCYALQALWCHRNARDTVLGLIEAYHSQQVDRGNGRPWHDVLAYSGGGRHETRAGC